MHSLNTNLKANLEFEKIPGENVPGYFAIIPINTVNIPGQGTIILTLLADDQSLIDYEISPVQRETTATARVIDIPIPELSFKSTTFETSEGTAASVKVIASVNPLRDLIVRYTPTETSANTDFLLPKTETDENGNNVIKSSGAIRTETLAFELLPKPTEDEDESDPPNRHWEATISIEIGTSAGINSPTGIITLALNEEVNCWNQLYCGINRR